MSFKILLCLLAISHSSLPLPKQAAYDSSGRTAVLSLPSALPDIHQEAGYKRPKRYLPDVHASVTVDRRDREDTPGCSKGGVYCGHELRKIWLSAVQPNKLYRCEGPSIINTIEVCNGECVRAARSYCRRRSMCVSGLNYCGHVLRDLLGDSTYNEHDLYQCQPNELEATKVASCGGDCVEGLHPRCTKVLCERRWRYCGDELSRNFFHFNSDTIYECGLSGHGGVYDSEDSNWRRLTEIRQCTRNSCISKRGYAGCKPLDTCSRDPFPAVCDDDLLEDFNSRKHEPGHYRSGLYFCENGTRHYKYCSFDSFCDSSQVPPRCVEECWSDHYCGHELHKKGWKADAFASNSIFRCIYMTKAEKVSTCSGSCNRKDKRVFCQAACVVGRSYCGHELDDTKESLPRTYIPSAIYRCEPNSHATFVESCNGRCSSGACLPNCEPGSTACGQALLDREITASVPVTSIAAAATDKALLWVRNASTIASVREDLTIACKFNAVYCGNSRQLSSWPHLLLHARYTCKGDNVEPKLLSSCSHECIKTRNGYARCKRECDADTAYCGFQLLELGFGEREHVDPQQKNYLYRCSSDNRLTIEQRCAAQCLYTTYARCIRECRPGIKYCGHELSDLGFADVSEGALYNCDNATSIMRVDDCARSRCIAETEDSGMASHCALSAQRSPQADYCGIQSSGRHKRLIMLPTIYNGENTPREEWPWMVSLRDRANGHFCGGVLIRRDWVLTAAHCVKDERKLASVVLGDYHIHKHDKAETRMRSKQIILHNRHNRFSSGDIALIQLEPSVAYGSHIRPICLPANSSASSDPTPANTGCKITGWGVYDSTRRLASKLQTGDAEIRRAAQCIARNDSFSEEVGICTGREHGSTTATICKGDSGGPLLCELPDGSWVVYGIASHSASNSCSDVGGDTQFFAFFTRVSRFVDWIKETVDAVANDPASGAQMEPAIVTEPQLADYEPDDS